MKVNYSVMYFDHLLAELYELIDIENKDIGLTKEQRKRYIKIVDILHSNNVEIPFGIVI